MGWKIEAWDTEDFSMVAGTHDPEEASRAWEKYLIECFGTADYNSPELEYYDELDWTTAIPLWSFEKPEETPFDADVEPRRGQFPYLELAL